MSLSGHQSSRAKSVDWLTPPNWLHLLGKFDLDPACPENMPWRTARTMFTARGLEGEWSGRVWLNPPFGREAAKWLSRLATHGNGIALVPARTETAMFYDNVWNRASAVCFVKGRPHFYRPDGTMAAFNSGAPIALIAYGQANHLALIDSGLGKVVEA